MSAADPKEIARDEHGNALGGIRLPDLEAPIATLSGAPSPGSPGFCILFGSTTPFDAARLAELYPDHDAYVSPYSAAVDRLLAAGFILEPDAEEAKAAAQRRHRALTAEVAGRKWLLGRRLRAESSEVEGRELGHPAAGASRAASQRSRSGLPVGSTTVRGDHVAATSSSPAQVPMAMPARNAAPSVVASGTGDTSTGRWVASASAWRNVALALMPPSTRSGCDRRAPPSASAASTRSAPRWAIPSSTARTTSARPGAAREADERAACAEVPLRRAQAEQRGHEPHVAGVGARRRHRVGLALRSR